MQGETGRLIGSEDMIRKASASLVCSNCHKSSVYNLYYQQSCHCGIYCSECIQFCSNCNTKKGIDPCSKDQILLKVSIRCKYCYSGCQHICPINSLLEHETNCKYKQGEKTPNSTSDSSLIPQYNEFFPNMSFIQADVIHTTEYDALSKSTIINIGFSLLEKRLIALESNKVSHELIIPLLKSDINSKIENMQKHLDDSLKLFMESNAA